MRFKIDENLPVEVSDLLKGADYAATTTGEEDLTGQSDFKIADVCKDQEKVLLTLDTDFANIRLYPPKEFPGIMVIRSEDQSKATVLKFVQRIISALESEEIKHKLWIVESNRIRIRESE